MLVFFLMWLVLVPFYFIAFAAFPRSWRKYIFQFSYHGFTRMFFMLTLIRVRVSGLEHLDPSRTYIIVSNHVSALDFMVNALAYPGVYKYLAKRELVRVPLFGYIVRKMCVLVDRRDARSRAQSIQYLKRTLSEGYSVFLYPEGTRNRTAELLQPFHRGAFKIAIESGFPIAIQTIINAHRIARKAEAVDLSPGRVDVLWSAPIPVVGLTEKDIAQLSERVREEMRRALEKGAPGKGV